MQTLGLDVDEYAAYVDALARTHRRRIVLEVTDLNGRPLVELEPLILGGTIHGDSNGDITRICEVEFLDPSRSLIFEADTPAGVPIHRSRMLRVHDMRFVPALGRWVDCVAFTGPIHEYSREGAVVAVVAHGKEVQAQGARWSPRQWREKTRKWKIIHALLWDTGERFLRIPKLKATTPKRFSVMRLDKPWFKAKRLAKSMGRQLFYDGRGVATLRRVPERPVFHFGPGMIEAPIRLSRPKDGVKNVFLVVGGRPRGSKRRVSAKAFLGADDRNSVRSLEREGEGLYLVERVKNGQFKTFKDARAEALRLRDEAWRASFEVTVEAVLPVPHLDERDLVRVSDGRASFTMRLITWDLPLTGDSMALGSIKRAGTVGGLYRTIVRTEAA